MELQTGSHGIQDRQTVMICHFGSPCSVLLECGHDPGMHVVAAAQRIHPVVAPMMWQIREEPYPRYQAQVLNNQSICARGQFLGSNSRAQRTYSQLTLFRSLQITAF